MKCVYVSTNCHKCAECANTKFFKKFLKIQQGELIENYSQILKSWAPLHNMHTFFLSNYEFKFLTRSANIIFRKNLMLSIGVA